MDGRDKPGHDEGSYPVFPDAALSSQHLNAVVPATAGTHLSTGLTREAWIPAFAGMTKVAYPLSHQCSRDRGGTELFEHSPPPNSGCAKERR